MGEFVNFLTGKGCDLAEATTCFQELDTDGEGGADITYCLAVSYMYSPNVNNLISESSLFRWYALHHIVFKFGTGHNFWFSAFFDFNNESFLSKRN